VAILARNHRGLLYAVFAAAKCGARIIMLNTDFGPTQLSEVVEREGAHLLIHDDEYAGTTQAIALELGRLRAWTDEPGVGTLDEVAAYGDPTPPPSPGAQPKIVILTSGTTGTPKGAERSQPPSLTPVGGLLSKAPFRAGEVTECAVPMFHALGFTLAIFSVLFGSTLVVRRRFDPERTLESMTSHRANVLLAVPVMLRRLIEAGTATLPDHDFSALRMILVSGSQLGTPLCVKVMNAFGPVVYNLYGSTEVACATIATPTDLASEPGCVGKVVHGATVKILDDNGSPVAAGTTGRIFVGNGMQFEGYTGGGTKNVVGGLMASGDVGHFDQAGRLFIDGRDDEMIVSGGENVYPGEVEETLSRHPDIADVAVIGVPDDQYGQRLRSFIALRPGASLAEQDVKDYVKKRLARFKVPRDVHFVESLPRNATGKLLKRLLDAETPPL
jgi:fatty-acyl-CoA synthase